MSERIKGMGWVEPEPNIRICRYISLAKLLDLVATRELYLPAVSRLRETNDRREGQLHDSVLPQFEFPDSQERLRSIQEALSPEEFNKLGNPASLKEFYIRFASRQMEELFASCWSRFEREDAIMWGAFVKDDIGVMIESSVGDLESSIGSHQKHYIGYINYEPEGMKWRLTNATPAFYKRREFKNEQEIRLVLF